ncbi:MAG: ATP phosphoribosyltransferase [Candidatus Micrarchaeota archaeon]
MKNGFSGPNVLRIAVPSKGRLRDDTLDLLKKASIRSASYTERMPFSKTTNPLVDFYYVNAKEIPKDIELGAYDAGITGIDMVEETNARVYVFLPLDFGKGILRVAVKDESAYQSLEDLKNLKIATSYPNITASYFGKRKIPVEILYRSGSVEISTRTGISDAIVDIVSSGATLIANNLRTMGDEVLKTEAALITNSDISSNTVKNSTLESLNLILKGIITAKKRCLVKLNAPTKEIMDNITSFIPSMRAPTISYLSNGEGWAVEVAVDEKQLPQLISDLKRHGARDILVSELLMLVP